MRRRRAVAPVTRHVERASRPGLSPPFGTTTSTAPYVPNLPMRAHPEKAGTHDDNGACMEQWPPVWPLDDARTPVLLNQR
jgi:hypothetical protein